jgi:hypothetical protein
MDLTLISFGEPAEVRRFEKGRFEVYRVGPMTLGRATYEPGWRWSEHVGAVKMDGDRREEVMEPGQFFHIPPGHDSWVVGDEPYVSLHIMGSEQYAS